MTVTNTEIPYTTSNETNKTEQSPYKRLITIASIAVAAWGAISTAGHFIGYSFLQGRIAGHGLGEHELTLSSFESIMQAGYATKAMFNDFLVSVISFFDMSFFGILLAALFLGGLLKVLMWDPKKQKENRTNSFLSKKFSELPKWLRGVIVYPTISLFGFMYLMLLILLVFYTLWTSLTLAHGLGYRTGQEDIAFENCVPIDKLERKEGYVASCTRFYDAKKQLYVGKIIHRNKVITLLQTNTESILFDKDRNIIACSAILKIELKDSQVKNRCYE